MKKQKIIVFIVAIIIIIVAGVAVNILKKEKAPGGTVPGGELPEGLPLKQIDWHNPDKPMQSWQLKESEIPEEAIRIGVSAKGFLPASFQVKKGEKVVLAVTSTDEWIHTFKFKDPSLAEVTIGLDAGETRAVTFYAPKEPGEYEFFCDMPNHKERGERGVLVVK